MKGLNFLSWQLCCVTETRPQLTSEGIDQITHPTFRSFWCEDSYVDDVDYPIKDWFSIFAYFMYKLHINCG